LPASYVGYSKGTASDNGEEGGDDVKGVKNRKDSCFFRAYRPGMQLSTAQQLWEQDKRSISERKDRRLTRISLSIAGVALLLNLAFQVYLYWPDIKSRWTKIETITEIQESDSLN